PLVNGRRRVTEGRALVPMQDENRVFPIGPGAGVRGEVGRRYLPLAYLAFDLWPTSWCDAIVRPASPGHLGYEQDEPNDNALLHVWHGAIAPSPLCSRDSNRMEPDCILGWSLPQEVAAHNRAIQFSSCMPMSSSANAGWAANRRQAAAILVAPAHRVRPMTVLRKAAMTCGILPQRTWDRSSSKVTSRTQCDLFSICQCPRTNVNKRAASARSGARLVTPATTSSRTSPVFLLTTCRSSWNTCPRPGHPLYP